GAYDAIQQTWPVAAPPDPLTEAMQTGDRLSYHPERATEEIANFSSALQKAQSSVEALNSGFAQHLDDIAKRISANALTPAELATQKQRRLDALRRAQSLAEEAGK
ncbi:MAG: hypothetical protein P4L03_07045, partial [Terracidiphilus sp.]|nr:hypothetical protein [Terracidiphilus sp.]